MHKNIPVAKLEKDDSGILIKVFEIYNTDHLPYSIPKKCLDQIGDSLQDWLINRSIPNLKNLLFDGQIKYSSCKI